MMAMVNTKSSRAAGAKLIVIVSLLLFPVLYLGQSVFSMLRVERSALAAQKQGLMAIGDFIPLVTAALDGKAITAQDIDALRIKISQPPLALGPDADQLQALVSTTRLPQGVVLDAAERFIRIVHGAGQFQSQQGSERQALVNIVVIGIPRLLLRLADLKERSTTEVAADHMASLLALGQVDGAAQAVFDKLDILESLSAADSQDLASLRDDVQGIIASIDSLKVSLSKAGHVSADATSAIIPTVGTFWNKAYQRLSQLTGQYESRLVEDTFWKLGLSLATLLLGLAGAAHFFGSTIRSLDAAVLSHGAVDQARIEAETMNKRLSDINDDVVRLNTELADKMGRLKHAQDELLKRGRLEQLGQLTATVAHELRNPLGAVRTSAFLLERKIKDKGLGVEPQLQRISNGIQRCDSIITQLLDFSRTKQIDAAPADFDDWLASVVEEEARKLPAVIDVSCSLGMGGRNVPFDKARMQRAVINLMNNASEALVGTGEDPSKYAVRNPRISIATSISDGMAIMRVSDNGPGIPDDILTKVREPLFTTKSFGTGLGIPAVDQIATQHGGRLDIESVPGQGATFTVLLPMLEADARAA
jgi:signal transduction histidine kinase